MTLLIPSPRNLIGQSQSGTGKTAAFTLNMLSRVDPSIMTPQVSQLVDPHTISGFSLTPRLSVSPHPESSLDRSKRSSTKLVNSLKSRVVLPFQDHGPETKKSTSTSLSVLLVPSLTCSPGEERSLIQPIFECSSLMRQTR
jgi:hypothetical protein